MIDVTEYQKLCLQCSVCDFSKIPDELKVEHNGILYIPVGFRKTFKNGEGIRSAILRDTNNNSEIYVLFEKINKNEVQK